MSNVFENELLAQIFRNAPIALLGDLSGVLGSASPGSLYVSLYTTDPGEGRAQSASKATYTVARSGATW